MLGLLLAGAPEVHAEGPACALSAGTERRTLRVGKIDRAYLVHVGARAAEQGAAPLVFLWHGFGQTPESIAAVIQPDRDWPEAIVVTPQGLRRRFRGLGLRSAEGWQVRVGELGDRDLEFFDAMRAELLETGCVDARRVYSTGLSNGAFLSNLLGCARGDVLAGIAPVAGGAELPDSCVGSVPVLITHGRADEVVTFRRAQRAVADWALRKGCSTQGLDLEPDRCTAVSDCASPVGVCVHTGGHFWPGMATTAVVRFFQGLRPTDGPPAGASGD